MSPADLTGMPVVSWYKTYTSRGRGKMWKIIRKVCANDQCVEQSLLYQIAVVKVREFGERFGEGIRSCSSQKKTHRFPNIPPYNILLLSGTV